MELQLTTQSIYVDEAIEAFVRLFDLSISTFQSIKSAVSSTPSGPTHQQGQELQVIGDQLTSSEDNPKRKLWR